MLLLKPSLNLTLNTALLSIFNAFTEQTKQTKHDMEFGWLEEDNIAKLALFPTNSGAVYIDFLGGKKHHRRQFGGGKGQPLAKAIGLKSNKTPTVLDATAGMGSDAFVLATLGCKVLMVERSPVVAALLEDAFKRGLQTKDLDVLTDIQNLSLVNADSTEYLLEHRPNIDVVYMDPMYPEKKKKAAVKKEMVALQNLVGADLDSAGLLSAALQTANKRVVVKRPAKAPFIELTIESKLKKPTMSINSPNTRYDVYVINSLIN